MRSLLRYRLDSDSHLKQMNLCSRLPQRNGRHRRQRKQVEDDAENFPRAAVAQAIWLTSDRQFGSHLRADIRREEHQQPRQMLLILRSTALFSSLISTSPLL
jgi:hypothetical protein